MYRMTMSVVAAAMLFVAIMTPIAAPGGIGHAQETPDLADGFPTEVSLETLADSLVDLPDAPAVFALDRVTLEPGDESAGEPAPGPVIILVESGELTIADELGIEGAYSPDQPLVIPVNALITLRNAGDEPVIFLRLSVAPEGSLDALGGAAESLASANQETLPDSPARLFLARVTFEPGADLGVNTFAGPLALIGESGTLSVAGPSGIEGQIAPGRAVVFPTGAENRQRNASEEPVVVLMAGLIPAGEPLFVPREPTPTPTAEATIEPAEEPEASATTASEPSPAAAPESDVERDAAERYSLTNGLLGPAPEGAPSLMWQFSAEDAYYGIDTADGVVYMGSGDNDGTLYALGLATGEVLWTYNAGAAVEARGVASGIVVARVFDDSMPGVALDAQTGQVVWQLPAGLRPSWIVDEEMVYAGGDAEGGIIAGINRQTGDIVWTFAGGVDAFPQLLHDGVVYGDGGLEDSSVYALDATTGAELWRTRVTTTASWVSAADEARVYVSVNAESSGEILALDRATGQEVWRVPTPGGASVFTVSGNRVVIATGDESDTMSVLEAESGQEVWRFQQPGLWARLPAGELIVAGSEEGTFHGLDIETGQERWRLAAGGATNGGVIMDGVVYAGSDDGTLYAIEAETGQEIWRLPVGGFPFVDLIAEGVIVTTCGDAAICAIGGSDGPNAFYAPESTVYVTADDAILRAAPSPIGAEVMALDVGQPLIIVGPAASRDGAVWWQVEDPASGKTGFVTRETVTSEAPENGASSASGESTIDLSLVDIAFEPTTLTIPANRTVRINLTNNGVAIHNFHIDELDIHSADLSAGQSGTVTFTAEPGTYEYYCNVPGHWEAGMIGTLIVN